MKPIDIEYLRLQFQNRIYATQGSGYQRFFEGIMEKRYAEFQRIEPYGNKGDAGNDGYVRKSGIYYQVYAPNTPKINKAAAAKKLKADFQKVKREWNEISALKQYNFVFNDKYDGSIQLLEAAIAELQEENPDIEFKLLLAKDLEKLFFELGEVEMRALGFNVDQRQAVKDAYAILEHVRDELDKEDVASASKLLTSLGSIVPRLGDDVLSLECELLECSCLQKTEQTNAARMRYEGIRARFPNDPRPILNLAEIALNAKEDEKNLELLAEAEAIDGTHWLLRLMKVIRAILFDQEISPSDIDETTFPDDPRIKANFYRLYALLLAKSGHDALADAYIARSLYLAPQRFVTLIDELTLLEIRLSRVREEFDADKILKLLSQKLRALSDRLVEFEHIGPRSRALLNLKELTSIGLRNIPDIERIARETFELLITCHFDRQIENSLARILEIVSLPTVRLNQLLDYLKRSGIRLSEGLCKVLIFQFALRGALFSSGKQFFDEIGDQKYSALIAGLEREEYDDIASQLSSDLPFAISLINSLKGYPTLRQVLIERLPEDQGIRKDKLRLMLYVDERNIDKAFEIVQQFDLSNLDYLDCEPILAIASEKEAWDIVESVLKRLLAYEPSGKRTFNFRLQLFQAYHRLGKYPDAIELGKELLSEDAADDLLSKSNREALLVNTVLACFERGKVDTEAYKTAKELVERYRTASPSFEYSIAVDAETYLRNGDIADALRSVVQAVQTKKNLSPQDYANLYWVLAIRIADKAGLDLDSLPQVEENTFVKLSDLDQWYYVGSKEELDTVLVDKANEKYGSLIGKKAGEKVEFVSKYGGDAREYEVEIVYPVEKFIFWRCLEAFRRLSAQGDLAGVQLIQLPQTHGGMDPQHLLQMLRDLDARVAPMFDMYCQKRWPLAILVLSEGGLPHALGKIQQEGRGFVYFSAGTPDEYQAQIVLARQVVEQRLPFYLDATSALMLAEIGLLPKVYRHVENLKVPQSVINALADISERLNYSDGQKGYLGYAAGRIRVSDIEKEKRDEIRANFAAAIKLLESKASNIGAVALASKMDCFSERRIPPEVSDACILAQREKLPVMTDDYQYLQLNESETKKKMPPYFSSLALIRVLYDQKELSYDEYLLYFGFLSTYRFSFLGISDEDIQKAVFGDQAVKKASPQGIRRLNLPFILAQEYGVDLGQALRVVAKFLSGVLIDNSVTQEISDKIFIEVLEAFPTRMSKKELGNALLSLCMNAIESDKPRGISVPTNPLVLRKAEGLLRIIELYGPGSSLWKPG